MIGKIVIAGAVGALIGAGLVGAVVATAAPEFNTHGNRFKPLAYTELTPEQKVFADKEIAGGRKPDTGPFNIYLRSPEYAELSRPLADYLRFKSPMPRKLKEIANMLTARYWGGQYVWYSHRQQALDAGLSPAFIAAMAAGERPANMTADEATVYDFTSQLAVDPAGERRRLQGHGGSLRRARHRRDRRLHRPLHRPHHAVRRRPLSRPARRAGRGEQADVTASNVTLSVIT